MHIQAASDWSGETPFQTIHPGTHEIGDTFGDIADAIRAMPSDRSLHGRVGAIGDNSSMEAR
jgi:hypothetical protein